MSELQQVRKRRVRWLYPALAILSVAALCVAMAVGSADIDLATVMRGIGHKLGLPQQIRPAQDTILFQIRMPRALLAFAVGGALAVAGCAFQGMFKNPMADSNVLGVSGGAGLGAALAMAFGLQGAFLGMGGIAIAAFAGSLGAVALVHSLARVRGKVSPLTLLLSGVAVGALLSALTSGLVILCRDVMERVFLWTMGSLSGATWQQLAWGFPLMAVGCIGCMTQAQPLNLMLLGEEEAGYLGVNTERVKRLLMVFASLTTAAAVAVSGVIGFVGLMIPHMLRLFVGPDHRHLMPLSVLAGGLFLLVADTLARTLIAPLELPVGVLTALCGGPFFLYLLRKHAIGGRT